MIKLRGVTLGAFAVALFVAETSDPSYAVEPADYENYLRGATSVCR